jgi:MYXO-CTERM domain-containing protein
MAWAAGGAAALIALFCASEALACGGTFCDSGPTAMPVDQTGENILFVLDGQTVEAHIQIQYQGEASRFAWVLPLPAVPELRVGSQPLFVNLLNASVPTYGFTTTFECGGPILAPNGGGGTGSAGGFGDGSQGPQVVLRQAVGAFDVAVLQGGTAVEVSNWLATNGYQQAPTAPAILDKYVAKGFVFAAVKLTGGTGIDEIHPLVVRYPGNEPCVPLELTAVAAVENMGVRAFFLGSGRVVPTNYKHVVLNSAQIDWPGFAQNYEDVVSRAMDSAVVNGRGFITEYAGPSNIVSVAGVYSETWLAAAFVGIDPTQVIAELQRQGLASCGGAECTFNHPLLLPILHEYLPVPAGVDEGAFYSCLGCYASSMDRKAWDGAAFALDLQERVILPGRNAVDLLGNNSYLTRLYTTISPTEMSEDPLFHARPDLPEVSNRAIADRRMAGSGNMAMVTPEAHTVALQADGTWPAFDARMPWAERIEEIPISGAPIELVDNAGLIDGLLDEWNASRGWPEQCQNGVGGSGGSGFGGFSGVGTGGSSAAAGGQAGTATANDETTAGGGGCGCSLPSTRTSSPAALLLFGLALLRRRNRARV